MSLYNKSNAILLIADRMLNFFIIIGFLTLMFTYYMAYKSNFSNVGFWVSIFLISIPISLELIYGNRSNNYKITMIFVYTCIIYIIRFLPSPHHFHFGDELYTFEVVKLILESGNLNIKPQFEFPYLYPGLAILVCCINHLTSIDIFHASKILIGFVHPVVPIFIYLFFNLILDSKRIALIGAFIYAINPLHVFFHAIFAYGSLGILFVIMLLYLVAKRFSTSNNNVPLSIIFITTLSALVVTHHFSSIMFLFFCIILGAVQIFYFKSGNLDFEQTHYRSILLPFSFILVWMIYVANSTITYLIDNLLVRIVKIFELSLFGGEPMDILSRPLGRSELPAYEFVIDTYIYPILIIVSCVVGFYIIISKYNTNTNTCIIYSLFLYGPVIFLLSLAFIPTSGNELATRLWSFSFIGVSLIIAIIIDWFIFGSNATRFFSNNHNLIEHVVILFVLTILIFGGISIGDKPIHRIPDLLFPQFVAGSGSMTTDSFVAAGWSESKLGRHNRMTSDRGTAIVFKSYSSQDVDRWSSWKAFMPMTIDSNVIQYFEDLQIKYIIIDSRITKSLAELGYYFDKKESYSKFYPTYGLTEKLPFRCIDKFNKDIISNDIYDNGNIDIYEISVGGLHESAKRIDN